MPCAFTYSPSIDLSLRLSLFSRSPPHASGRQRVLDKEQHWNWVDRSWIDYRRDKLLTARKMFVCHLSHVRMRDEECYRKAVEKFCVPMPCFAQAHSSAGLLVTGAL